VVFRLKMQSSDFEKYFDTFPQLKKHFKGIFSINTLPKSLKFRDFLICNTDISTGPGIHWFFILKINK
jgi:hypothetical protein